MIWVVTYLLGLGFAVATYWWFEGIGRHGWFAILCRGIAWGSVGALVLNLSCARQPLTGTTIVLLDASLSFAGGPDWTRIRDSAATLGELRFFGDERSSQDTTLIRGRSLLGPALRAAAATDRPILVLTDGELEDAEDLPADLLARATIAVLPRDTVPDAAITRLTGPARVTLGDSLVLEGDVAANSVLPPGTATVLLRLGETVVARDRLTLAPGSLVPFRLAASTRRIGSGSKFVRVEVTVPEDRESRNNTRLHHVDVIPTPGVVIAAEPGDWDARFLYRTLVAVAELPVKGYVNVAGRSWRTMRDLAAVSEPEVRRAMRNADLVIAKGKATRYLDGTRARGVWRWPSGEGGATRERGDWYVSAAAGSPMSQAFIGLPVDSFPPATEVTPLDTAAGAWVGLTAQLGRRGAVRPIVVGAERRGRREVQVAADGLWRWAFRGGTSEQGYRAWVAATVTWLLGRPDSAAGVASPVRSVVANARPLIFRWTASDSARPLAVEWDGPAGRFVDTLAFDGNGHAAIWLPPGVYGYRFLSENGGGQIGVEEYSDEWSMRRVAVAPAVAVPFSGARQRSSRDVLWPFGVAILALIGEWTIRRRRGLR